MENCIFCKIAAGEIPSNTIYEDDSFRVILDLGPATKGHALILPKNHYANIYEIPEDEVDFDEAMSRNRMYTDFETHKRDEACNLLKKEAQ